ncbi:ABC transporter ATP-binding protein [Curtobacterium sp. 18060]|uniref:ABC transporter ATP-binding protein n=1 Tax=Curtobacterium sp. 18060 TaxID=2681408 RepID=UPI0013570F1E|nr:ABC transporter ATP-binding protein [Curtobacterium sp. 18060]
MTETTPDTGSGAFWQLARPIRGRIVLAGTLAGLGGLVGLATAVILYVLARDLVDGGTDLTRLWTLVVALVVALVVSQSCTTVGYIVSHVADADFAGHLRQRQISKLFTLRLDWFSRTASGRVKKLVQDDVQKVHQLVAHVVPDTVNGLVRPIGSLVVLFVLDWHVGLVALVPLVCAVAVLPLMAKDLSAQFTKYDSALGELSAAIVEFVRGIAPIKVFEVSGRGHRRFAASARSHHEFYMEWMGATAWGSALVMVATSPAFAILVNGVGATILVLTVGLHPAVVVPVVLLSVNIATPLYMLVQMQRYLREANGSAANLVGFFALHGAPAPDSSAVPDGHRLELDHVTFAYEDGPRAVDDVSVALEPGTVTALVGPSGSGKSTLASLVPRLVDPDSGVVRLGGLDLQTIDPARTYREVGFVFQQPYLLRMSVRDNISVGRPDSTDAEVEQAARAAQIHDRITRLPNGYDTIVGEDAHLSGGEQQRLSIARALLLDTPLLVLDEATAFADPDSEAEIQRALAVLTRDRTLLVIAHRLHTITGADRIVVLDAGRVAESGTHDGLVAADGLYARMWSTYQRTRSTSLHDDPRAIAPHDQEATR